MNLANQKGLLAKLLAGENITVEHQPNAQTAAFDVKNRKMILPVFKEMSGDLYDLFVGHETGHATETPEEGWHDAVIDDMGMKSFLNVVEDVRIERLIQNRYPGLRKSFIRGYKRLMEMDFFGVQGLDLSKLPLIDRINLHFKVGDLLALSFSEAEQPIVDQINAVKTWADVVAAATALREYSKGEASALQDLFDDLNISDDDSGDEAVESPSQSEKGEQSNEETEELQSSGSESTEDVDDGEDSETLQGEGDIEPGRPETDQSESEDKLEEILREFAESEGESSHTDDSFRGNESNLYDKSRYEYQYLNFKPIEPSALANTVVDFKKLYTETPFTEELPDDLKERMFNEYKDFERKSLPLVSSMAQSFMRKQRAAEFRRAQIHKTGELANDRLWAYKTSEDLFQRNVIVPDGKNHGFIMYVDMSQSMWEYMHSTVKQVLTLAMFARKINVPFEVYGFINSSRSWDETVAANQMPSHHQVTLNGDFNLYTLLSSRMKKTEMQTAMRWLYSWGSAFTRSRLRTLYMRREWMLGSTPLTNALVAGVTLAKMFQDTYNVEVLNTVLLTDGDATDSIHYWADYNGTGEFRFQTDPRGYDRRNVLTTGATVTYPCKALCESYGRAADFGLIVEHYKKLTGSVMINYHITDNTRGSFNSQWEKFVRDFTCWNQGENVFKEYRKKGWIELRTDESPFDSRFLIREKNLEITDMELESKTNKTGDLTRAFKKFTNGNKNQRVLLNRFAEAVA